MAELLSDRPKTRALTAERARSLLDYDPLTGIIRWKVGRSGSRGKGEIAGVVDRGGYIRIRVDYGFYRASHLAFLIMTGEFPALNPDHKNRLPWDNRWDNLREATPRQNKINCFLPRPVNPGLPPGVSPATAGPRFRARIKVGGKKIGLGTFDTPEEAYSAYVAALGSDAAFAPMEA